MSDQQQPVEVPDILKSFLAGLAKQVDERLDRRDAIKGNSLHENRQRSFQDGYAQGLQGAARSLRAAANHLFASKDKRIEELEGERDEWQQEAVTVREARSREAFEAIKDRITDELDKQAGASAALSVAVALAAAAENGKLAAEHRLEEAREALKHAQQLVGAQFSSADEEVALLAHIGEALASLDTSEQEGGAECNCSPGLPQVGAVGEHTTAGCPVHGTTTSPSEDSGGDGE